MDFSGLDETVSHEQSESMKEFFRGIGVRDAKVRIFSVGHWGIVTCKSTRSVSWVYFTVVTSINVWDGWAD